MWVFKNRALLWQRSKSHSKIKLLREKDKAGSEDVWKSCEMGWFFVIIDKCNLNTIRWALFLSLVLTVPSLFGEEILTLYNNTIYQVAAEINFRENPVQHHLLSPREEKRIKFPTFSYGPGVADSGTHEYSLVSIRATVPAQQEPIWEGGKIIGKKIMRQEKSVVLNISPKHLTSNTSFVINANRNVSFINGIQQIDNLAIYRFIQ